MRGGAGQQAHQEQDPVQKFGTVGIRPMGRPTLVTRIFMRIVSVAERLNLAFSKVGSPPSYDHAIFPWTRPIENEWRLVRARAHAERRAPRLPRVGDRRRNNHPGPRLEKLHPGGLRLPLQEQYRPVPADMENLPEHSGAHQRDVFNSGAGKYLPCCGSTLD